MKDLLSSIGWKGGSCALLIHLLAVMIMKSEGRGEGGHEQSWMARLKYIAINSSF